MYTEEGIEDYRPIDDTFFEVLADDKGVCQELLQTILEDETLIVEDVIVQSSKRNIESQKGQQFKEIVDVIVVYISEFDIFKQKKVIYHVDNVIREQTKEWMTGWSVSLSILR